MISQPKSFNIDKVKMNLGSKSKPAHYLEVKYRLMWFREVCPMGTIETKLIHLDMETEFSEDVLEWNESQRRKVKTGTRTAKGYAVVQATVSDGQGNSATGMKMERAVSFPDFLEKCETGAIGRALAALGYGTGQAGNELDTRIVDAPFTAPVPADNAPATSEQIKAIKDLCNQKNRKVARPATYGDAAKLIDELQAS